MRATYPQELQDYYINTSSKGRNRLIIHLSFYEEFLLPHSWSNTDIIIS